MGRRNGVRPIIGSPFQCHGLEPLEQRCLASGTPGMDIAPVVTTSAGSAEYTEDGEPMVIDPGLTVSDPDSMIAGATVRIGWPV